VPFLGPSRTVSSRAAVGIDEVPSSIDGVADLALE
jgi:hypothetical protein